MSGPFRADDYGPQCAVLWMVETVGAFLWFRAPAFTNVALAYALIVLGLSVYLFTRPGRRARAQGVAALLLQVAILALARQ